MQALRMQAGAAMIRAALFGLVTLVAAGCSSVEMISGDPVAPLAGRCDVQVFQTKRQAEKLGEIEELCIINGSSAGSFSHTISTAIEKHKSKACGCGANKVYIESRRETGLEVATVTIVAFKVVRPISSANK